MVFGFISGFPLWEVITWDELVEVLENDPFPTNPILNDTITMAVSPHDFVSFYSRALQGEFFAQPETLRTFRAVLALADAIPFGLVATDFAGVAPAFGLLGYVRDGIDRFLLGVRDIIDAPNPRRLVGEALAFRALGRVVVGGSSDAAYSFAAPD